MWRRSVCWETVPAFCTYGEWGGFVPNGNRGRRRTFGRAGAKVLVLTGMALVLSVVSLGAAWYAGTGTPPQRTGGPPPGKRDPLSPPPHLAAPATAVLAGTPEAVTAGAARALFASAPVVVVASA